MRRFEDLPPPSAEQRKAVAREIQGLREVILARGTMGNLDAKFFGHLYHLAMLAEELGVLEALIADLEDEG